MTDVEQREAARIFVNKWIKKLSQGTEGEKQLDQAFWNEFVQTILGVSNPTDYFEYQKAVYVNRVKNWIDLYIPETKIIIEQKSQKISLDKPQPGHNNMTPYEQAKLYNDFLPYDEKARWIITSNFNEIWIYDMNAQVPEPVKIMLQELTNKYRLLDFIVKHDVKELSHEMTVSIKAGDIVGDIYDALRKQYRNPDAPETLNSLNKLCVRLVFCLYAEDAGVFGRHGMFHDYLAAFDAPHMRQALIDLFHVLDEDPDKGERDPYLLPELAAFPYVNGGLFADEDIEIPLFTDEIRELILVRASEDFDWSEISPTIFGAVFESTLNTETRRKGGMHYTSIENIHKVIDPLFLDALKDELEEIEGIDVIKTRTARLRAFQDKLASLTFLDPACGSGNFLTESYICLRRLENRVIKDLTGGQIRLGDVQNPVKVSISQFYGIEINDFAVTVAKTALWIAESQMLKETEDILYMQLDFLPLKTNAYIHEGNALRMDWNDIIPAKTLNYIMGNPPFVGHQWRSKSQVSDMDFVFSDFDKYGKLDYVASWYKKAYDYMKNTNIYCALVSTNSICQGESVATLWKPLFSQGLHINFAYQTFRWNSEANIKAHVHCVIIGFSHQSNENKKIFNSNGEYKEVKNINGYLLDAPNIFIINRGTNLTPDLPKMSKGSQPTDGGNLILSESEKAFLVSKEPLAEKWIHRFMMGDDFINNKLRYCLWLVEADPSELKQCPLILERGEKVRMLRLKSPTKSVQKDADTPLLFTQRRQPSTRYLVIPRVSSEQRRYIPMGYLTPDIIAGDKLQFLPNANEYMFGVLMSNVHMAWMRTVCGRLEMRYSYSPAVYNNFPWPSPTPEQKASIEQTAQGILDARAKYPDSSLADLYDPLTMPAPLNKAHVNNDKAVMAAYGFSTDMTESECVAALMKMYQELTAER